MRKRSVFTRFLALFLSAGLVLPPASHALRPQMDSAGLEERLSPDHPELVEGRYSSTAGLEEPIQESRVAFKTPLNLSWNMASPESANGDLRPISNEILQRAIQRLPGLFRRDLLDPRRPGLAYQRYKLPVLHETPGVLLLPAGVGYESFEARSQETGKGYLLSEIQLFDFPREGYLKPEEVIPWIFLPSVSFRGTSPMVFLTSELGKQVRAFEAKEKVIAQKLDRLNGELFYQHSILHEVGGILWVGLLPDWLKERWRVIYPLKSNPERGNIYLSNWIYASTQVSLRKISLEEAFSEETFSEKFALFLTPDAESQFEKVGWSLRDIEKQYFQQVLTYFEQKSHRGFKIHEIEPAAGLEEELDPEVKDLLGVLADPSVQKTKRLYRLSERLPKLNSSQRGEFVRNLVWYSDHKEATDLFKEVFLNEDPIARLPVRLAILDGIKNDPTGEAIDAFETLFSQLPLKEMEPVFHRTLSEINDGGLLEAVLEEINGLAESEGPAAVDTPLERDRQLAPAAGGRERLLAAEKSPLAIGLARVNSVLFEEIKYGELGSWKKGWETQGPVLALAMEHAFLFEIGRQWTEEHALSIQLEEFLYKQLRKVAVERVWLSRQTHPAEPLTEGPDIEKGFGFFYKLIAHRLHARQRVENRRGPFPTHEASEARDLFLSLRNRLSTYSETGDRFLRHRVLQRMVELEDDYSNYLVSLGNLMSKNPQFVAAAQQGLAELQREFEAKRELKNFRIETRARLGLLEPPASFTAGLEEPLVEDGKVVLNRVADWLKQKLNALRADDPSSPEADTVLIRGSAGYLSDDQNRLPVAVLNNRDLVGDLDVTVILRSPVSFEDSQEFRRLYEDHEEEILTDLKSNLVTFGVVFSGKMDGIVESESLPETLRQDAEYFFQSHQGDVNEYLGSELIRIAWVSRGEWNPQYKPLDVAKRYLELEQLAGDLAFYRRYRDRLVTAADPAAEAEKILQETLGRRDELIKKLDDAQVKPRTLSLIQKRMEDRLIGLEPDESEQTASWVGKVLGVSEPMLESVRDSLMAGKEIIWGRGAPGAVMPTLARLTRVNEDLPQSHNIQKHRTIYVEEGFLPEETVEGLSSFGTVVEMDPDQKSASWVSLIMAQSQEKKESEGSDAPKDLIVVQTGSELETGLVQALEQKPESWGFPMAVVAVPAVLVSQISARDLTLYLLDVLTHADPIAQRRMERLESIRETGTELQLLSTRA